jgi:hypothetical protein
MPDAARNADQRLETVIFHTGGFVEVSAASGLLLLTVDEYERAQRRGESVSRNREANHIKILTSNQCKKSLDKRDGKL